jgi:tRNA dimethylallyltransferase
VRRLGLTLPRDELYRRVDARVDEMIAHGWLDEVRALAEKYAWGLPALSSLGYPQLGAVLRGETTIDDAARAIKHHTHRFVRHQYAWFRRSDARIAWFAAAQVSALDVVTAINL